MGGKCSRCGGDEAREVAVEASFNKFALSLCDQCYKSYEPLLKRGGLVWRKVRPVRFMKPFFIMIESRRLADGVSKLCRPSSGALKLLNMSAIVFIPFSAASTALFIYSLIRSLLEMGRYRQYVEQVSRLGVAERLFLLPSPSTLYEFVIALMVLASAVTVHELMHAVASSCQGLPPRSVGLVLVGPIPIAGFTSVLNFNEPSKNLKVVSAGVFGNLIMAFISLLPFLAVAPPIYFEDPRLLMLPPPIARALLSVDVELHWFSSLLLWSWTLNLYLSMANALILFPGVDGNKALTYILERWLGYGNASKISFYTSILFTLLLVSLIMLGGGVR